MLGSLRLIMGWLHTWVGVLLGFVMMIVFFFGTLTVFSSEIDCWAIPQIRVNSSGLPSFDRVLRPALERLKPSEESLAEARERIGGPIEQPLRQSYWSAYASHGGPMGLYTEFVVKNPKGPDDYAAADTTLDPATGAALPGGFAIGGDFFYPLHFGLMLRFGDLGIWIVGVATLMMLATLISGIFIHKKFFTEFFTFRPWKQGQRRVLDLHNLTGVVALPFHFVFCLTGLLIFAGIHLPINETMLHDLHEKQHEREAVAGNATLPHKASGVAAQLAPIDPMVAEAQRRWAAMDQPSEVRSISVSYIGDAASYVSIYPQRQGRFAFEDGALYFEGSSGRLIPHQSRDSVILRATGFLIDIHLMPFEHRLLRWLFFIGGLAGCVCIATGLLFFVGKRKRRHAIEGVRGARVVDALAVTTVTGILVATLTALVVNRLLPDDFTKEAQRTWQIQTFWLAWLVSLVHGAFRTGPVQAARLAPAWREQCYAVAVLAASAAALNWITTGDHLVRTIGRRQWAVAGVDLVLLATAAIAVLAAVVLHRSGAVVRQKSDVSIGEAEVVHD